MCASFIHHFRFLLFKFKKESKRFEKNILKIRNLNDLNIEDLKRPTKYFLTYNHYL